MLKNPALFCNMETNNRVYNCTGERNVNLERVLIWIFFLNVAILKTAQRHIIDA
jgi:hypothetical protein